jgi:hypothetical protein
MDPADGLPRGRTPREVARIIRMSKDRVLDMIRRGELQAINTAPTRCGRPRYIILPEHLAAWVRGRTVSAPAKPARRRRRELKDYFEDLP